MIRELFDEKPIVILIALLSIALIFISLDGLLSKREYFWGTVVDKHYKAEIHRTGTGYGVTGSGQTGMVITTETEREKFLLMIKSKDGKIVTADCSPEFYYEKEIGQEIEYAIYIGWLSGTPWFIQCIK